ncbi:hypothetical protein [Chryseobacterium sp.]|uniref:hypothetical protein n=1 Tax=Chryseobacterium sp. TaxID=1871047 RepID=UPI0028A248DB|nr:hypothetical protein [Chryseobacterium sp.]
MSRLNLDQFKKKTELVKGKTSELEKLTGGILGACHCPCYDPKTGTWHMGNPQIPMNSVSNNY